MIPARTSVDHEFKLAGITDASYQTINCINICAGLEAFGSGSVWQEEFFDHVLRSNESYSQKWEYVKENPVRAGFVKNSEEWPFQGEIEPLRL